MFLAEDYSSEIRGALAVAWFAFSLYWAAVCGYVATEKGRRETAWAFAGFFGWFLALIPLAAAPSLYAPTQPVPARRRTDED